MSRKVRFESLLSPFQLGSVKLKNRMVKPGQVMGFADKDYYVSERFKDFYEELARGGVGTIVIESTGSDYPLCLSGSSNRPLITDDKFIPKFSELTQIIHKYDCATILQLGHAGPAAPAAVIGRQPLSASSLPPSITLSAVNSSPISLAELRLMS